MNMTQSTTSSHTAEAAAPGKLYIAGEYAVVEPGHPSIVIAVDRFLTARLEQSEAYGSIHSLQYSDKPLRWERRDKQVTLTEENEALEYVLAAIRVTEQWLLETGTDLSYYHLTIDSQLDSESGKKYGLGSSGAVTVAVVRALLRYYQQEHHDLLVYKLAALAHLSLGSNGSFGDLAASAYTGWVAYSSFDRTMVRRWMDECPLHQVVEMDWPSLSIEQLTPPGSLQLLIGWTGSPASTTDLVGQVKAKQTEAVASYEAFLEESKACVTRMTDAFRAGDVPAVQKEIRHNRLLLNQLKDITGVVIETPSLTQLCAIAEAHGGAAKSSGAGGGDCGIALFEDKTDLSPVLQQWAAAHITALLLNVHKKNNTFI